MNFFLKKIFRSRKRKAWFVSFIDSLFFKNSNKVLFAVKDRTYFSGNLRVVLESFLENSNKQIYVYKDGICNEEIKKELETKGVTVLSGFSIKAIWYIVTAGVVILSHNPRDAHIGRRFKSRKIINLWHGIAIKNIEFLMRHIEPQKYRLMQNNAKLYDLIIASSLEDKKRLEKAFGVSSNKVVITGLPRYEMLKKSYKLSEVLKLQEQDILKVKGNKKLILYAPTFRENIVSPMQQINASEWEELDNFAKKSNVIIGIRPHPYDNDFCGLQKYKNLYIFNHKRFTETNILLRNVDILVVDYSSIWIDYLLLKRPIVGFAKDFEHYVANERAFCYDFKSIFPSEFVSNISNLILILEKTLSCDTNSVYNHPLQMLHKYGLEYDFQMGVYRQISQVLEA